MRIVPLLSAALFAALPTQCAEIQGVIADWQCVKAMVDNGRERTLKDNKSCSLGNNYSRSSYGVITNDKKYYRLDDAGRAWALKLLKDTHDKDRLYVVVTGTIDGEVIHVSNMSEL
ncbi:MAG: hypothetical protein JO061_01080 [Acidobacteriaceae bacterium]|nr:hypothetical protein [Acidobacteriaceae bacterium]